MKHYSPLAEKPQTRTLAHVLLDLAEADAKWKRHWDEDGEADYLDRVDALSDEARAMIAAATGVTWNQISEACL